MSSEGNSNCRQSGLQDTGFPTIFSGKNDELTPDFRHRISKDAMGATGGDIHYVMADAVENVETSGSHAEFGSATMQLLALSSDGTTNPLSFTRA